MRTQGLCILLAFGFSSSAFAQCPCQYTLPGTPAITSSEPIPQEFGKCEKHAAALLADVGEEGNKNYVSDYADLFRTDAKGRLGRLKSLDWGVEPHEAYQYAITAEQGQLSSDRGALSQAEDDLHNLQKKPPIPAGTGSGTVIGEFASDVSQLKLHLSVDQVTFLKSAVLRDSETLSFFQCASSLNLTPTQSAPPVNPAQIVNPPPTRGL